MKIFFLAGSLLLVGCANVSDPRVVADSVRITHDPYSQNTSIIGERVTNSEFPNNISYRLRSISNKEGGNIIQLYVEFWSQIGWYFLNSANDIDGIALPVIQIDREVNRGSVEETIGVALSRDYLALHKNNGLDIKIFGQRGTIVIKVPAPYINGFLMRYDQTLPPGSELSRSSANLSTKSLGITMAPLAASGATRLGIPPGNGVIIVAVRPGSAAEKSGLKAGDVLVKFDGQGIDAPAKVQAAVKAAGDTAAAEVIRAGQTLIITVNF